MAQIYAVQSVPAEGWVLAGPENARVLCLAAPCTVTYSSGPADQLPDHVAATVSGGGAMNLTTATYVAYTVQGSLAVTVCTESAVSGITGTFAILAWIRPEGVFPWQQTVATAGGGGGGTAFSWATKTASYTITGSDSGILVNASSAVTITLPTAVGVTQLFAIKRSDATYPTNTVTIATTSSQTIDGATTAKLTTSGHGYVLGSDGANWLIEAGYFPNPLTAKGQEVVGDASGVPISSAGGTAMTAAAGANAGTSPPAPLVTATRDGRGVISFGTGTTPAAGAQVVATFTGAYAASPAIVVTPLNSATQALGLYISAYSTTAFTVSCASAPAASQTNAHYAFSYIVEA